MPRSTQRRLPVRARRVVAEDGSVDTHHTVHCPRADRARPFERCCGCTHMVSVDIEPDGRSGSVTCIPTEAPAEKRPRVDVAEAAVRTRIVDAMSEETTCIRASASVERLAELLVDHRALPVVDEGGKLVGIVSRTDGLRQADPSASVSTVMTPRVHGLPEEAPIAYAISLMAFEQIHEVPIVTDDGSVVGMLSACEALRWVACALGYVAPKVV